MKTLKLTIKNKITEIDKERFNILLDEIFGMEDQQIHTFNPLHPIMQHVYLPKSSMFDSLLTMIYKDHQIEILKDDETVFLVSKYKPKINFKSFEMEFTRRIISVILHVILP